MLLTFPLTCAKLNLEQNYSEEAVSMIGSIKNQARLSFRLGSVPFAERSPKVNKYENGNETDCGAAGGDCDDCFVDNPDNGEK